MKKSLILLVCALTACVAEPLPTPDPDFDAGNARVNAWIRDILEQVYYWPGQLAPEVSVDNRLPPDEYFDSLLWSVDREAGFSRIEPAEPATRGDAATGMVFGYGMVLQMRSQRATMLPGTIQVKYVIPGSPADKAGIRRGDRFSRYDGKPIGDDFFEVIRSIPRVKLAYCDVYGELTGDQVTVAKGAHYDSHVILDTSYRMADGKNIGYLFYDRFDSARGDANDVDLRAAIGRIKAAGADELILDLRYNGGGWLEICIELATLLLPSEYGNDEVFLYQENAWEAFPPMETLPFSNRVDDYRLDLDRLHVIVSGSTASASEITVHGLEQYMEVVLYGERTTGKNVGSYLLSGTEENIPWNLMPISFRIYDKRGKAGDDWQTFVGLEPDHYFTEREGGYLVFRGQLGEYDPGNPDCEPFLNFVMSTLGYVEPMELPAYTRAAEGEAPVRNYFPKRTEGLIDRR